MPYCLGMITNKYEITSDNKGVTGDRGESFASRCPNGYIISVFGRYAGEIVQIRDTRFHFTALCWLVALPGTPLDGERYQSLAAAKAAVKAL